MTNQRRKRNPSDWQKQVRFLTVLSVIVVLAMFAGLIFLLNR